MIRIGHGYDVHRFKSGGKLILGGIEIPHTKGIEAHSDGDVITHAICDALLGAAALGDIGQHFPDTAKEFADVDSQMFLQKIVALLQAEHYRIENVDTTVLTEQPKLAPYIIAMREKLAKTMNLSVTQVSVKATTSEKMGFIGRGEGIAVHAVVLIKKI